MLIGELASAGAVGVTCGVVLNVFYLAVRHAWPENYFGLGGSVDPIISRNIGRYAIFRFGPPLIVAAAAALTSERLGFSATIGMLTALVVHAARSVWDIGLRTARRQWGSVVGRAVVLLIVCGASVLGLLVRDALSPVVPMPSELVANLWAGVLAAIGAVYLQGVALVKKDPGRIVRASFDEIDPDIGGYAVSVSRAEGLDPRICLAVMAAENAQRPKWLRKFEALVPPRWRTSGIMQQTGARGDRESVDLAVARYFSAWGHPDLDYSGERIAPEWLEAKVLEYNNDTDFAALVRIAMEALEDTPEIMRRFSLAAV